VALQMFLDGDWDALACYHRNNRDPVLMGYLNMSGWGAWFQDNMLDRFALTEADANRSEEHRQISWDVPERL